MPKRYWSDLKRKLTEEGSQLYENIVQLKMKSPKKWKKLHKKHTEMGTEKLRNNEKKRGEKKPVKKCQKWHIFFEKNHEKC